MSGLDLSAVVDEAARAEYERCIGAAALPWESLSRSRQHYWREAVLQLVTDVAQAIAAQVREQIAADVDQWIATSGDPLASSKPRLYQHANAADSTRAAIAAMRPLIVARIRGEVEA